MPNHVINEIHIHDATMDEVVPLVSARYRDKDAPAIDFSVLVPLPNYGWPGNVGSQHKEHFSTCDLDEAVKRWGTKWNAYGLKEKGRRPIQHVGNDVVLTFETAWATPRGWTVSLFRAAKKDITVLWLSEGRGNPYIEIYKWESAREGFGPEWEITELDKSGLDIHTYRHLYKLLWGRTPEEMGR